MLPFLHGSEPAPYVNQLLPLLHSLNYELLLLILYYFFNKKKTAFYVWHALYQIQMWTSVSFLNYSWSYLVHFIA